MLVTEIMNRLTERYSSCSTYFDSGEAVRWDTSLDKPEPDVFFKTLFIRPSKFHFHCSSEWGHSRLWSDGDDAFINHQFRDAPERYINIQAANKHFGLALGAADEIPHLLIPKLQNLPEGGRSLIEVASDLTFTPSEPIDGEDCYRIVGSFTEEVRVILWISKQSFYLKQIQEISILKDDVRNAETEYWSTIINYKKVRFDDSLDLREFESEKGL